MWCLNWLFTKTVGTINLREEMNIAEDNHLTIKKWFYVFWTTLAIGAGGGLAAGLLLQATDINFEYFGINAVGYNLFNMVLGGATISVLSQMGFFGYLIIRFIALGFFRNRMFWWNGIQIIIMIVVVVDLVYLRYSTQEEGVFVDYLWLPIILLVISWTVAQWKVRLTHPSALIPTLFFMIVVTTLEAVPALRLNQPASTFFMLTPLILCNAWQILILHKLIPTATKEPSAPKSSV